MEFVGSITEPFKIYSHCIGGAESLKKCQPVIGWLFLYEQLSEPNSCGFGRMLAMNTDMSHEYSDLSHEYVAERVYVTLKLCA